MDSDARIAELEQIAYWLTELEKDLGAALVCAQFEADATEYMRIRDNEYLLGKQGELQSEIDRLSPFQEIAFDMGSHLKFLVTALCPIVKDTMAEKGDEEWENLKSTWEDARARLNLTADGLKAGI